MTAWNDPKLALSAILVALFAAAYFTGDQPDEMMKGAMIAAFSSAYGYWLGSSSGSARKTELISKDETE